MGQACHLEQRTDRTAEAFLSIPNARTCHNFLMKLNKRYQNGNEAIALTRSHRLDIITQLKKAKAQAGKYKDEDAQSTEQNRGRR